MRFFRSFMIALALAFAVLCFAAQTLDIPNPGFEQVDEESRERQEGLLPAQWRARSSTFAGHRLSEQARSGQYAASIHFEGEPEAARTGYYYSEPQPLVPCREVTVSAWANVHIPQDQRGKHKGAYLRLMFERDEEYVCLLDGRPVGDTGGEWVRLELSGIPPAEANGWRMSVEFNGIGTARFDDTSAEMLPLPTLQGASIRAPAEEPMPLGDGFGMLGTPREPTENMAASTTVQGRSAVAPRIVLGAVWYKDGQQMGVQTVAKNAWMQPTDITMRIFPLAGADAVRPVAYAESQEQWNAVAVECPELQPSSQSPDPGPTTAALTGHPRLFITPGHLQRLRELVAMDRDELEAEHPHFAHHLKIMLRDADACFDEEKITVYNGRYSTSLPPAVPERHPDNFPYWTGLSREIEWRIEKLAAAYLLTGEQKYADLCSEWSLALCEWPQWTDPDYGGGRNSCLDTGHFCHAVAFAYDFIYDTLSPGERETMRNALIEKGAAAVMKDATEGWAQSINWPNGFAVVMGGMGIAAAATYGDDPRAAEYLNYARRRIDEFLDSRGVDGGYVEGHTYGGYAMSHIMPFAGTLAVHGDDMLVSHPYILRTLRFITYCLDPMSATSVNFCDSSYSARAYRSMAAWLAREGNSLAYWYLAHDEGLTHSFRYVPPMGPLWLPLDGSGEAPAGWANGAHFRDIGWTIARSGFSDEIVAGEPSLLFAMRAGYYGSHCQADCNSFMLNVNGRWILQDAGYGRDATSYHSTLLVDGKGQRPADAHVEAFGNIGRIVYAVGDASVCYPDLETFRRHAVMVNGEYLVLFDEVDIIDPPIPIVSQLVTNVANAEIEANRTVRLVPSEGESASEQALSVWLPEEGEITTDEWRGNAKVLHHYERGGLSPMLLWPHASGPEFRGVNTVNDEVCCMAVRHAETTDYIMLNLTGHTETITAPDGPDLSTDARLVWIRMTNGEIENLSMAWGTAIEMDGEVIEQFDHRQDFARE